ncbi:hypothetical protein [Streptomyces oceani]|uniref:Uncharacterized protein n=1 Tax=Streptomyces oceani TaxID=1075402 RepID=A0A1E7KFM9_9ACTN|nr:hypothetical protein [Streptomyces oceani]OEV02731.1 hypothetical protein AN216_14785 [Streptomyces oceani]
MPEDVGGQPYPHGEEPEDRHHGDADDEFAAVVFDEDFVRGAEVHEPTAAERILAAPQPSHPDSESRGPYDDLPYTHGPGAWEPGAYGPSGHASFGSGELTGPDGWPGRTPGPGSAPGGFDDVLDQGYEHGWAFGDRYGPEDGPPPAYRGHARWQRPVAWVLAVVMGIGVVALAFAAVYRGATSQRQEPTPPPSTGVGAPSAERDRVKTGAPSGTFAEPVGTSRVIG